MVIRWEIRLWGYLLAGCGLLLMVALASYSSDDPSWNTVSISCQYQDEIGLSDSQHPQSTTSRACQTNPDDNVRNLLFRPGAYSADLLLQLFGIVSWLCPLWLVFFGLWIVFGRDRNGWLRGGGSFLCVAGLLGMLALQSMVPFWNALGAFDHPAGGSVGILMIDILSVIPFIGQHLVAIAVLAWSSLLLVLVSRAWTLVRCRSNH